MSVRRPGPEFINTPIRVFKVLKVLSFTYGCAYIQNQVQLSMRDENASWQERYLFTLQNFNSAATKYIVIILNVKL